MSKKTSELDQLGNSNIPSDLLTPTLGSNYGLDGYPDMGYGMGVLEGVLDPEFMEPPALPTGLSKAGAEGMDLTGMMDESLTNLDWLDPTQLQDLERLPKNPVDLMIPELVEAWGVNRRTTQNGDSIQVQQRDLSRARYEESLGKTSTQKKATASQMVKVVTQAMRRSASGQDIDLVVREALESMGEEMGRVAGALREVRREHGLVGNVYVRASAYPGYGTGKWTEHVNKYASKARYILVSPEELRNASWIQNGRCSYTSKIAVTEIPWKQAFQYYAPRFDQDVRSQLPGFTETASQVEKSPEVLQGRLRQAFLFVPEKKPSESPFLPHHVAPSDRVSLTEARSAFESHTPDERRVYDPTPSKRASDEKRIREKIEKMASLGQIEISDRDLILSSRATPEEMIRMAAGVLSLVRKGAYVGDDRAAVALQEMRDSFLERKHASTEAARDRLEKHGEELTRDLDARRFAIERDLIREGTYSGDSRRSVEAVQNLRGLEQERKANAVKRAQALLDKHDVTKLARGAEGGAKGAQARLDGYETRRVQGLDSYSNERGKSLLQNWIKKGFTSKKEVSSALSGTTEYARVAQELLPSVLKASTQMRRATYKGANRAQEVDLAVQEERNKRRAEEQKRSQRVIDSEAEKREAAVSMEAHDMKPLRERVSRVEREINRGVRGQVLRDFISRTIPQKEAAQALKILRPLLQKTGALKLVKKETPVYEGAKFTRTATEAKGNTVLAGQVLKAKNWVRRMMNEGFAGKDLDDLISNRLSSSLLKEATGPIAGERFAHEGGAGFLYVDAEAYASPTGVTGCEQGALKHRANQIPSVAMMPRCETCTLVKTLEDGTRKCSMYNKPLLEDTSGSEIIRMKKANILVANQNDQEQTASMFAPTYNPTEFGLRNSNLEEVELEFPENAKVADISFGGWDL